MAFHTFGPGLALDKITGRGVPAVVAQLTDAETGDPVQAYTMDETPVETIVSTNRYGYFDYFQTADTVRRLRLVFGGLTLEHTAWELIDEAERAAQQARNDAELARIAAQQAANLVGAPADDVVSTLVRGPGTQTREALFDEFGARVFVEKDIKKDFGAVGDGVTLDDAAFIAALAPPIGGNPDGTLTDRTGQFIRLKIPFGVYRLSPNVVTWDIYRCVIDSQQAVFLFDMGSNSDVGLRITSTSPKLNGTSVFNQLNTSGAFTVRAAGTARRGTGVLFGGTITDAGTVASGHRLAAQATLSNMVITGFNRGITFGDNAYMIGFRDIFVNNVNQYVYLPSTAANSGERIWFDGCTFGNQVSGTYGSPSQMYTESLPGIWMEDDQSFIFNNCSFDWTNQLIRTSSNSEVFFNQCHFETPLGAMLTPADNAAGRTYGKIGAYSLVSINQSRMLFGGSELAPEAVAYLFDINNWGFLTVNDTSIYCRRPFVHAWGKEMPAVLRNVESFQAFPQQSSPMPAISRKATISRESWDFATLDTDWTWSGGDETGDLLETPSPGAGFKSMKIHGAPTVGTWIRLTKKASSDIRHVGLSFEVQALDAYATEIQGVVRVKDSQGHQPTFHAMKMPIDQNGFTKFVMSAPLSPTAWHGLRSIETIEFEINTNVGSAAVSKIVADYWA